MKRLQPKLTDDDRSRCARLLTAFLCGDRVLLEATMTEADEAEQVNGLLLGLLDHCCWVMEHTTPLSPTDVVDPRDGMGLN